MNNDRKIFEEISEFLAQGSKPAAITEAAMPFAESRLHLLETAAIRAELNEARAGQHLLKQFSAAEIAHNTFVDEAVAVLNYRVKNLHEARPSQQHPLEDHEYHKKSDAALAYISKDAHAAAEAMKSHNTTAENKYRDQASDAATVRYWRQKNGMPEWYKKKYGHTKTNESVDLEELSTALLGKYKSAAGKAASAADAAGDVKTGNKRFSGIMKATKKQFANDDRMLKKESEELEEMFVVKHDGIPADHPNKALARFSDKFKKNKNTTSHVTRNAASAEDHATWLHNTGFKNVRVEKLKESEELDELSARTLGSYVKKATVDVAQNSFNSGRKVHEPKEYHRSKQAAKSRIQGVMRAATKLSKNESAEPADRALWSELVEQARTEFDSYPSIASAGWIAREYAAQGGEWMVEDAE